MTTVRTFGINGTTDPAEDYRLIDCGLLVPVSALNARSGVTSTPTLTSTGAFTCNIGAFTAAIDGTSNALQGVYRIAADGPTAITVSPASAQARIDLIYAQILDNNYDGSGLLKAKVDYLAGAAGSGSAPATPANAIPLFNVPVAASASSADFAHASGQFPFTAAIGGIVAVRAAIDKPPVAAGVQYRHRLDVTATASGPSPLESSVDGVTYTPVNNPDGAFGAWTNLAIGFHFAAAPTVPPQWRTAPGGKVEFRGIAMVTSTAVPADVMWTGGPTPSVNRSMPVQPVNGVAAGIDVFHSGGGTLAQNSGAGPYPVNSEIFLDGCWCSA